MTQFDSIAVRFILFCAVLTTFAHLSLQDTHRRGHTVVERIGR